MTQIFEGWQMCWAYGLGWAYFVMLPLGLLLTTYVALWLEFGTGRCRFAQVLYLALMPYAVLWLTICNWQLAYSGFDIDVIGSVIALALWLIGGPLLGWYQIKRVMDCSTGEAGRCLFNWSVGNVVLVFMIALVMPHYG